MEYTNEKKSSSVAKAGLTLGIIGTTLGLLAAGNGAGFTNGIFGGLGYNGNARAEVSQTAIASLESEVAQLKSMRYSDALGIDYYKNMVDNIRYQEGRVATAENNLFKYIVELDKKTALNEQAHVLNREYDTMARDYQFALMDAKLDKLENKFECCCEKQAMVTNFNKQLTDLADASIISYVNSNFIPGTLKLPASAICSPVVLS